jgi:nitrogen-specific signal transduction histidine kinase
MNVLMALTIAERILTLYERMKRNEKNKETATFNRPKHTLLERVRSRANKLRLDSASKRNPG